MTVSKINPVNNYAGDNSVTKFDFDFLIEDEKELLVQHTNSLGVQTTLVLDKDYSINEVGNKNGSYITFPLENSEYSVLAADEIISLSLELDIEQDKEYANSSKLNLSTLEWSLDYIIRILQTMSRKIARSVKVQEGSTQTADELVEVLQEAQINASTSAASAAASATSADTSATSAQTFANDAEESYNNTVNKYNEFAVKAEQEKTNIETLSNTERNTITALGSDITNSIDGLKTDTLATLNSTAQQQILNVQALGIFMENDRLFYYDSTGVKKEFRNDFGGIAPMAVKHKEIKKTDEGFLLTWSDPDDSVYQNNIYCTWGNTLILRKEGAYPESPFDGEIVIDNKIRNQYADVGYLDEVDTTKDWKYRAFPCSINKVYSLDDFNKFGLWIYSFTRIKLEATPAEKIIYRGVNTHYKKAFMNFSANKMDYGDWENAPFLLKDRLAPCVVGFDGELKYFLNPNNYKQKEDGTPSDVTNTGLDINCFMRFKTLFRRKRKNANGDTEIDISNEKVNEEYKPYGGFIKPDGTLREYIYLPIYRGSLINGKIRSMSGNLTPVSGQTTPDERNYCQANGAGHDMITHADREMIEDLYMLMFKNMDSQSALGQGKSNGGSDVEACLKSGTMDDKGLFWGSTSTAEGIKLLGMENRYASQWERILGEVLVNGVRKVKLCQGTSDGSTVEDFNFTGDGYIALTELPTISGSSGGWISREETVDDIGTFPVIVSGSSSTYECDGMWFNNSGTMVSFRGGALYNGAFCGVFCSFLNYPASRAGWSIGSSVSFKPL